MNLPRAEQDGGDGLAVLEDDAPLHGLLLGAALGNLTGRRRAEERSDVAGATRSGHGTAEAADRRWRSRRLEAECAAYDSLCHRDASVDRRSSESARRAEPRQRARAMTRCVRRSSHRYVSSSSSCSHTTKNVAPGLGGGVREGDEQWAADMQRASDRKRKEQLARRRANGAVSFSCSRRSLKCM